MELNLLKNIKEDKLLCYDVMNLLSADNQYAL